MDHNPRKTFWTLPVAAVAAALFLAGCGGGSSTKVSDGPTTTPPTTTPPPTTPTPAASTVQERFDARSARREAELAEAAAITAVDGAVTAVTAAASAAADSASDASKAAARAVVARTDSTDATANSAKAAAQSTAALTEKEKADAAKTALDEANTAYMTATADADIATQAGAKAIKDAAMTLEAAADKAKMDAMAAQTAAETAKGMAMTYATAVTDAAETHVLELFKAANADDVDVKGSSKTVAEAVAAEVKSVGAAIAEIANATGGKQAGAGKPVYSATWPNNMDDPATSEVDESDGNVLTVKITNFSSDGKGKTDIESDLKGTAANLPNAKVIDGLGKFTHGFDVKRTGDKGANTQVIVFTDKDQDDAAVAAAAAVTARDVTNLPVGKDKDGKDTGLVTKLGTKSGNMYTGAEFTPNNEGAMTGTLTCPATGNCSVTTDAQGNHTVTGYVFTGSREAKDEVVEMKADAQADANNDYLMLGLWLDEAATTGTDFFGAFAVGGKDYEAKVHDEVTGTATYRGKAAGAHHKTGAGVNWFDADARLTADFGDDSGAGSIEGSIDNIRVNGGAALSDSIHLGSAGLINSSAVFDGNAVMGAESVPGANDHPYNGTWSGSFYGANDAVKDSDATDVDETMPYRAPDAVAGTFGVTKSMGTGTSAVTESYVGAFGAHKE